MSEFVNVETSSLEGRALDWAVAIVEGWQPDRPADGQLKSNGLVILVGTHKPDSTKRFSYSPSTSWVCGGPLIEKFAIGLQSYSTELGGPPEYWVAASWEEGTPMLDGPTPLVAACRTIVAHKLGATISVPAALREVKP